MKLLLGRAREALLAHHARDDLAELVHVERLLDVVDGVELHRRDGAFEVREAGEDDDCDVGVELSDEAEDLDAVELGHHEIEDDEVVAAVADLFLDARGVAQRLDLKAVALEQRLHVLADGLVVVDDEYSSGGDLGRH